MSSGIENNNLFGLMANPNKFKIKNTYKKNEYLKLYINYKFNSDLKTINNLINYIEEFINNIDLDTFIINDILTNIITTIDGEVYRICNQK